jgi:hypothetical protein
MQNLTSGGKLQWRNSLLEALLNTVHKITNIVQIRMCSSNRGKHYAYRNYAGAAGSDSIGRL